MMKIIIPLTFLCYFASGLNIMSMVDGIILKYNDYIEIQNFN